MTILAPIALLGVLWLAIVNTNLVNENESYERILNEYAKRLSHEKGLREQAEQALLELVDEQQDFIKTLPITALLGQRNKLASTTQSVQVVEQVFKGKSRKSEQLQSKKATPTLQSSKKLGATRLSSTKATTLKVGLRKGK